MHETYICIYIFNVAQTVKNLPSVWETWVQSLSWEDPLEEGLTTHSDILAWRIPWTEEPGVQRVGLNWMIKHSMCLCIYIYIYIYIYIVSGKILGYGIKCIWLTVSNHLFLNYEVLGRSFKHFESQLFNLLDNNNYIFLANIWQDLSTLYGK